jgi:hypothetical protein
MSVLRATERLPQPLVMDGIVHNDIATRTLVVSRPGQASGYQKLAWRMAHEALVKSEQGGWRGASAPHVWASGGGQSDIAFGVPGDNLTLLFHFPVGKRRTRRWLESLGCLPL